MTAMPCGQKNNTSDTIHNQTVTPPLAAIDGTTFRLKMATTNSRTKSARPRTRLRCGCSGSFADNTCSLALGFVAPPSRRLSWGRPALTARAGCPRDSRQDAGATKTLVRYGYNFAYAFLLCLSQCGGHIFERRQVLVDIGLGVLDGDGPLFVPPVRLRHYPAVDHGEPVVPPQIDVDSFPVAVVANLFGIEHQRAVGPGAGDVALQARLGHDLPVAFGQLLAELVHVRVVLSRENFAERGQASSHRNRIGVVSAAVEDLVLRDQVHDRFVREKRRQGQASANRFGQADHVRLYAEV